MSIKKTFCTMGMSLTCNKMWENILLGKVILFIQHLFSNNVVQSALHELEEIQTNKKQKQKKQ